MGRADTSSKTYQVFTAASALKRSVLLTTSLYSLSTADIAAYYRVYLFKNYYASQCIIISEFQKNIFAQLWGDVFKYMFFKAKMLRN